MPYNYVAGGFCTKKLRSRLSSREDQFWMEKAALRLWAHLEGLRAAYDVQFILDSLESA